MAKNKFKDHSCELKNESSCEEELEDEDLDLEDEEKDFYEDSE